MFYTSDGDMRLNIISSLEYVNKGICDLYVVYISGVVTVEHH